MEQTFIHTPRVEAQRTWWTNERPWRRLAVIATLLFIVAYSVVGILKNQWFGYGWNMALYEQEIWNGAHGRFFQTSLWGESRTQLGLDLFLTQLLFIPFYLLGGQTTASLIVLQTAALGLGALPMYSLGRLILKQSWGGLLGVVTYLLLPAVAFLALREFDPRPFALVALLFAIYAFHQRRFGLFVVASFFALASKSDLAFPVFGFGLLALLERRGPRWWLLPFLLAIGWLIFSLKIVVPIFSHTSNFQDVWPYYGYLGQTEEEIIGTILSRPLYALHQIFLHTDFRARFWYWLALFAPLAFLPFAGWRWMAPALPTLLFNTFSAAPIQWDIRSRHQATLIPFLCVAALYGVARVGSYWERKRGGQRHWLVAGGLVAVLMGANLAYRNPLVSTLRHHEPPARVVAARALLAQIPPEASVSASAFLLPHLVQRQELQIFMGEVLDPSFISLYEWPPTTEYFVGDARSDTPLDQEAINQLRADLDWQMVDEREGFVLLRRR